MAIRVRGYRPADAEALSALYERSVRALGPRCYAPAQVEAWAANAPTPQQIEARCADGRLTLVAVDDGERPVGYGDLEADGHIGFLYCAPEAAGSGVGSALCAALEDAARERGLARLFVEASEVARPLLERRGFAVMRRNELRIGGVEIHNYSMEKRLAAAPDESIEQVRVPASD